MTYLKKFHNMFKRFLELFEIATRIKDIIESEMFQKILEIIINWSEQLFNFM